MILWLKLLLNYYFRIYKNFIISYYYLFKIKISSLFHESRKISVRSLIFLSIYFHFSIKKQINKVKLLIKREQELLHIYKLSTKGLGEQIINNKIYVNNNKSVSIKLFLFFILKGLYLWMNFDVVNFLDIITHK